MEIIRKLVTTYHFLFDELADPTTKHWPLIAKPYQSLTILIIYLLIVLKWGPQWMKNRPAFNLDKILMVYNLFQVVACFCLFIEAFRSGWGTKYKMICQPVNYSFTEEAYLERRCVYMYYLLKITDLLDTVFFVLRKKFNQISFLHVYHHAGMMILIWGTATYYPGGHGTLIGVINLFVHVIMYSYYFASVAVPSIKNTLAIKKSITQIQLLQFFLTIIHMSIIIFKKDCEYPRFTAPLVIPHNIFLLLLFADFYIKTYIKKPKAEARAKTALQTNDVTKDHSSCNINNGTGVNSTSLNDTSLNGTSVNDTNPNGTSVNDDSLIKNNVNYYKSKKEKSN